mgnify:CR=1 FL=1
MLLLQLVLHCDFLYAPLKGSKKKKKGGGDKIPLDGGLGILVLGAAAFGIKKLRSKKNDIA